MVSSENRTFRELSMYLPGRRRCGVNNGEYGADRKESGVDWDVRKVGRNNRMPRSMYSRSIWGVWRVRGDQTSETVVIRIPNKERGD